MLDREVGSSSSTRVSRVTDAIDRSTAWLLSEQRADGEWEQPCDAGVLPTAHAVIALHALGRLDAALVRRALDAFEQRHVDGAFAAYPGGRADFGATATVLAALHVARTHAGSRLDVLERLAARAHAYVAANGGASAVVELFARGDAAPLFWVAAGLLARDRLPNVPGARAILSKPGRALFARHAHVGLPIALSELLVLREPGPRHAATVIALHDEAQDPSGSFLDMVPQSALAAIALRAAGVSPESDRLRRLGDWLVAEASRGGADVPGWPVFRSSTWTTAMTLRALLRVGLRGDSDAAIAAGRWLMAAQHDTPMMAAHQRTRGAHRTGGWAFQGSNRRFPDCDDTAVVLDALAALRTAERTPANLVREIGETIARGLAWLWDMQNADGGWSAYAHGLPSKPSGPILTATVPFTRDTLARSGRFVMGDPSTEDVTARVVRALASSGFDRRNPRIRRALAFLEGMRDARGLFWGRWSTNFLWAGSHVRLGAHAAGVPHDAPWLVAAHRFQRAHQNADGGYGESVESYRDPERAGIGASQAALGGLVLEAECASGTVDASVHRLARHLLDTQEERGTWSAGDHLQVMIPPSAFYRYPAAATFQPLEGLAAYRARLAEAA